MINKDTIIIRIETNIAETDFEDKIVLLDIENGEYYNFNETGSDLWRWLKDPHSINELAVQISEKYDCSIEECTPDIMEWINLVLDKKLLKIL